MVRPTAPLIRSRLKFKCVKHQATLIKSQMKSCADRNLWLSLRDICGSATRLFSTGQDFFDVPANELQECEWDNKISFFGRFQVGRTLT